MPRIIACFAVIWSAIATPAVAEPAFPRHEITAIVPFAAGGTIDIVARIVAASMSRTLGQTIIIENIVGTGGTTASMRAMRSAPDGYTIMFGHAATHAAALALNPDLPYDPVASFDPIGLVSDQPILILGRHGLADNLGQLVSKLRDHPDALTMAHAGAVSLSYATCNLFNSMIGGKPKLAPFQGTAPAMNSLIQGRVDYMCDQIVSVIPQVQAKLIKPLAIATAQRNPSLPDVPTTEEAGLPGFTVSSWIGLFAPRGVPPDILERLNAAISRALDDEVTRKQLLPLGSELPAGGQRTREALARRVQEDIARWKTALRTAPARKN